MSLIDRTLTGYRYSDEIEKFLNIFKAKTCCRQPSISSFDELYGILPPTSIHWLNQKHPDDKWGVEGSMSLRNDWNQLKIDFWYTGKHWYCSNISILSTTLVANLEPPLNREEYKQIHTLSTEILEFLMTGFNNQLLRNIAIRNYIFEQQGKTASATEKDLLSEIFISLLSMKLREDEVFNQDLFCKRAERLIRQIAGERTKYCFSPGTMELSGIAAARGSYLLSDKLYMPINLVWGFLANEAVVQEKRDPDNQPYYYLENYFPDKPIEISQLHPAGPNDKTEVVFYRNHDSYKQVFPDYETALSFHRIAKEITQKIGERI